MLPSGAPLQKKETGDEIAAEDEEGIDAEEAATRPREAGMIGEDGGNSQGTDTVERRLVGEPVITAGCRILSGQLRLPQHQSIRVGRTAVCPESEQTLTDVGYCMTAVSLRTAWKTRIGCDTLNSGRGNL